MGVNIQKLRSNGGVIVAYSAIAFTFVYFSKNKAHNSEILMGSVLVFLLFCIVMTVNAFRAYYEDDMPTRNSYSILMALGLILLLMSLRSILFSIQC